MQYKTVRRFLTLLLKPRCRYAFGTRPDMISRCSYGITQYLCRPVVFSFMKLTIVTFVTTIAIFAVTPSIILYEKVNFFSQKMRIVTKLGIKSDEGFIPA